MKSAVIYYSRGGVTKSIAEKIRNAFGSDMYFVKPEKAYGGKVKGKVVVPFATAGANGKESSLATVKQLFSECTVSDYFYTTKPKDGGADEWIEKLKEKLQ